MLVDDPNSTMMSTSMPYLDSIAGDVYATSLSSNSSGSKAHTTGPAFESAVASYASRVLKKKSPPESVIDASVGPYVTSTLRAALQSGDLSNDLAFGIENVENLADYDGLMELLEEHCNMSEEVAKSVLKSILKALLTGVFDDDENRSSFSFGSLGSSNGFSANTGFSGGQTKKYRSLSMGAENDYVGGRFRSLSMGNHDDLGKIGIHSKCFSEIFNNVEFTEASKIDEEPSFFFEEDEIPVESLTRPEETNYYANIHNNLEEKFNGKSIPQSVTPLKPDRLIPGDLLGFMDDSSSYSPIVNRSHITAEVEDSKASTPSLAPTKQSQQTKSIDTCPPNEDQSYSEEKLSRNVNKKKKTKVKDIDLAASFFSRPRSRSIHDTNEKSPKLKPMAPPQTGMGIPGLNNASSSAILNNSIPALFQKQLDSAVQILMAMNYDLCEEAAHEAALVSNADVNLAQHVIDGALSAPPVCRHMLNDGCYRSDCQFSHDVEGHTCLFWLKGRCGKGESCKFLHGFSEKLLDGLDPEVLNARKVSNMTMGTLLQPSIANANSIKTTNLVQHNMMAPFALPSPTINPADNMTSGNQQVSSFAERGQLYDVSDVTSKSTFSFAKIASEGYSEKSSFSLNDLGTSNATSKDNKFVRIPQNLWNPFYNRSSNAFHISDPIARYKEVSATTHRTDVIDLHFQSIKTFPIVLSVILPEKLRDHQEVWIVTGSGHHVSSNSHQKGGGVLENAVVGWLLSNDYNFMKGRDKNGHGGACLVKGRNR